MGHSVWRELNKMEFSLIFLEPVSRYLLTFRFQFTCWKQKLSLEKHGKKRWCVLSIRYFSLISFDTIDSSFNIGPHRLPIEHHTSLEKHRSNMTTSWIPKLIRSPPLTNSTVYRTPLVTWLIWTGDTAGSFAFLWWLKDSNRCQGVSNVILIRHRQRNPMRCNVQSKMH